MARRKLSVHNKRREKNVLVRLVKINLLILQIIKQKMAFSKTFPKNVEGTNYPK